MEKNVFDKKDFIRTENYNIRIGPHGAERLIIEISEQLSKKVHYRKASYEWRYMIFMKARELALYVAGKGRLVDFSNPQPELKRQDDLELRRRILSMYGW